MKKLSQRDLLQEDFADMVRAAGRVAADIYAPVIKPIKDALNAWESPEKALREYVKNTPSIRITKIISTKPIKTGSSGGRIGIPPSTAGLTKGRFGTNIYQIEFEAEIYNPVTGVFEQAYTPSSGGILMPTSFIKNTTPSSSTPPASASPAEVTPDKKDPKVYRADIERIGGKYRVVGIYDSKGKPVSLSSRNQKETPEGFVRSIFDGSTDDYTIKFKQLTSPRVKKVSRGTDVYFIGYVDKNGAFNNSSPTESFIAKVSSGNNNIVNVRRANSPNTDIPFVTPS